MSSLPKPKASQKAPQGPEAAPAPAPPDVAATTTAMALGGGVAEPCDATQALVGAQVGTLARDPFSLAAVEVVYVRDDQFETFRRDHDGQTIIGTRFTVVVEAPSGARWEHPQSFSDNARLETDSEGFGCVTRDRAGAERAEALAQKIQGHLKQGGALDPEVWIPMPGCYGSHAWDESLALELERNER